MEFYLLADKKEFKRQNFLSWNQNAKLWFEWGFYHNSLRSFIEEKIKGEISELVKLKKCCVFYDFGCGSGWVIDFLKDFNYKYIGIDNNTYFISKLREKYSQTANLSFLNYDIESSNIPKQHKKQADIAFVFFTLIELADIKVAISNISKFIRPGGHIFILGLNPVYEIVRNTSSHKEEQRIINLFENPSNKFLVLKKNMERNGVSSRDEYYRILYSLDMIKDLFVNEGMGLIDFSTNIYDSKFSIDSPVYNYLHLLKP